MSRALDINNQFHRFIKNKTTNTNALRKVDLEVFLESPLENPNNDRKKIDVGNRLQEQLMIRLAFSLT